MGTGMRAARHTLGWFETLRRDRHLFVLLGAILMLVGMLQPLAEARAAETGKAWIICTVFGATKPGDPSGPPLPAAAADDCPICLVAQHHDGKVVRPAVLLPGGPVFPMPEALARSWRPPLQEPVPASRPGDPPPAIRGPPPSA
jgi:hypothetical protein